MKISVEQLKQLNKEEYILIDIRDAEEAFKNPIENSIVLSGKVFYPKNLIQLRRLLSFALKAMSVMLLHKNCRKNMKRIV